MRQKGKVWTDSKGNSIETWAINPVFKVEDEHANRVVGLALKAEKALKLLNEAMDAAQTAVFEAKLKDAQIKEHERIPRPESLTFSAYDKSVVINLKTTTRLTFDKTYVGMVKAKFEEFFKVFDSNEKDSKKFAFLRGMIDNLMYKNNGEIDQTSVNELRAQKATAERSKVEGWELFVEAVDLFDKAIRNEPGNRLYYIDVKEGDKMRRVALKYTDI
jgi:Protein of unknown function (DUF3164).